MNNAISSKEWEDLANEVYELQDMLWHSANMLSEYDLMVDRENYITEDQKIRYKKECFDFHLADGWGRLMKIRDTLAKLGMPKDIKETKKMATG
ncbi:MAG: hypothetical protein GTO02_02305 [Candidatus Dadabacteria bacterium]|nr:hypothetical protein [Candidatus Dadabacteria bacterium]NIQ13267.1 hypothetical protein [Candidatus Dadabacteria bacterium]